MYICVEIKNYSLTLYKTYEKLGDAENRVIIRNDKNLKAKYAPTMFADVKGLAISDTSKIEYGKTKLLDFRTGKVKVSEQSDISSDSLKFFTFAHRMGLCAKDEKIVEKPKKLITELTMKLNIIYKGEPYITLQPNGKDKVVLLNRKNNSQIRALKSDLINNKDCYAG